MTLNEDALQWADAIDPTKSGSTGDRLPRTASANHIRRLVQENAVQVELLRRAADALDAAGQAVIDRQILRDIHRHLENG